MILDVLIVEILIGRIIYIKKVLNELQEKVLGKEEFEKIFIEKVMKDLYTPY